MNAEKISISLPQDLTEFIKSYQEQRHFKSRSEVIHEALLLLQQQQLETYYKEANQEIDPAYDNTTGDGLNDKTW